VLPKRGFSLIELLLVLVVLAMLGAVVIDNLSGSLEQTQAREQVTRLSTLLRALRAEAANTGRKFHLGFDSQSGKPQVSIEKDPLGQPGVYEPYQQWWVSLVDPTETAARVVSCRRTGGDDLDESQMSLDESPDQQQAALETLCFSPSGASDSARLVVYDQDPQRPWAVEITLNGVDGSASTREMDLTQEEPQ
jgi:prepilin-type N-terminal cleavage/methylation domain-containing protein